MKKIAIIGSNGYKANYGGFDQLVNNIVHNSNKENLFYITQPRSTKVPETSPKNLVISRSILDAPGVEGVLFDAISVINYYFRVDTILFLGAGALPLALLLSIFKKKKIIVNNGGLEWEREKFSKIARLYLKFLFKLSAYYSDILILDNETFMEHLPKKYKAKISTVSYGGIISHKLLNDKNKFIHKYPFLKEEYYLSVSRAISDNNVDEICNAFLNSQKRLVLISNFSSSNYGKKIFTKYKDIKNIHMIDGLYKKDELDLIRLNCLAYVHTHAKCGTAPSLVEMVVAEKPIISIDIPANRYTLMNQCLYFKNFKELENILAINFNYDELIPNKFLSKKYAWPNIAQEYLDLF